jgi:methyltransferase-like protein/SAM-dependent methyltransferase
MSNPLLVAYEATPYHSHPITQSFPPTLEAVALAFGVEPPPSDRARILELGCAAGGNIIPLAERFPESEFVGVDLTPGQINVGQAAIDATGLTNVRLHAMDITDIGDDFGSFDYIICHGVYSWVPSHVQDAILRVCSRNLAPNGLVYLSYNTYPGWRLREMVRDMLVQYDDRSLTPAARVSRARAVLDHFVASQTKPTVHAGALKQEAEAIRAQADWHILHEQLEPYNAPVYFAEFVKRAAEHGLAYLAESKLASSASRKPKGPPELTGGDDVVRVQQYIDFVHGRSFRRSLLCREGVARSVWPTAHAVSRFQFAINAAPVEPDAEDVAKAAGREVISLATAEGGRITTNNPVIIAIMRALFERAPAMLGFDELIDRVAQAEAESGREDRQSAEQLRSALPDVLMQLSVGGFLEVYGRPVAIAPRVGDKPVASVVARHMAKSGKHVTNQRHYMMELSDVARFVLRQLDGSKTRDELVMLVSQAVAQRALRMEFSVVPRDPGSVVDEALGHLALQGLLLG